jgi:hypothetical protein
VNRTGESAALSLGRPALGAHPNDSAGDVLVFPATDEATNRLVAHYQDGLADWTFGALDLSQLVRKVRSWSADLLDRFIPSEVGGRPVPCPEFLFRFEREGTRVLGHYVPGRNDTGLRCEISVNPVHLSARSERQIAAVILHEQLHWLEETVRVTPRSAAANGYHSAWFRHFAESLGIPCTRYGAELGIVTPSRFSTWADERGLSDEACAPQTEDGSNHDPFAPVERPVGKRVPWVCSCPTGDLVTVQVPRGSELQARCERCGDLFKRKQHE